MDKYIIPSAKEFQNLTKKEVSKLNQLLDKLRRLIINVGTRMTLIERIVYHYPRSEETQTKD